MKYPQTGVDSVLFAPTASATTVRTANLDCADANYATIRVAVPAELNTNSTNVAMTLSESDDTTASNFATFDSTFNRTIDNTAGTVATSHIDLEGRKRYIRVTVTPDTTTNGPVIPIAVATLYKTVQSATDSDFGPNVVVG
jgi:hypothetical protein